MGSTPNSRGVERDNDLPARDDERTFLDGDGARLIGDVVMVTLECAPRNADPLGEGMEFVQRCVAHQVAPQAPTPMPVGFVQ